MRRGDGDGLAETHVTADGVWAVRRRPGILVLVNDVDWELLGTLDYALADGVVVLFISTLHGG